MADVKISGLPAATVPLAGTEVLPIVQSSTTKQVSVANLTAGRAISASSVTNSALTSGRVTYASTSGLLADSANLLYSGTDLTVYGLTVGRGGSAVATNTAVGASALTANTSGANNTIVGYNAGSAVTSGGSNVFIGSNAGVTTTPTTTGSGNVYIGYSTYGSAAGNAREIAIGYNVAGQGANIVTLGSDLGKIYCSYTVNATWTQTSDGRMKKDIKDDSLGLSFINRLRPVTFTWKPNNELDPSNPYYAEENKRDTTTVVHGLVAQEVKEALDAEGVDTFAGWVEGVDGVQAISREMFISPLVKAIQELTARLTALESK